MGSNYPDVILSFQPLDSTTKQADCGLLEISKLLNGQPTVAISKKWSLPVNTDEILDLCFGELTQFTNKKGVFVLYKVSSPIFGTKAIPNEMCRSKTKLSFCTPATLMIMRFPSTPALKVCSRPSTSMKVLK
jgi:hypothetical protein